jgi:hypothetical protein
LKGHAEFKGFPKVAGGTLAAMRGRGVVAVCAVLLVTVLTVAPAAPASASTPTRAAQSNSAAFTYDRAHPERTVVSSAAVITRTGQAVTVTLTAVPHGRIATVSAAVANTGSTAVRFPTGGLRVAASVTRDGRSAGTWVLRAPRTRTLAPGAKAVVTRSFVIPRTGTYEATGFVRYSG